jgi:hypothetical protein
MVKPVTELGEMRVYIYKFYPVDWKNNPPKLHHTITVTIGFNPITPAKLITSVNNWLYDAGKFYVDYDQEGTEWCTQQVEVRVCFIAPLLAALVQAEAALIFPMLPFNSLGEEQNSPPKNCRCMITTLNRPDKIEGLESDSKAGSSEVKAVIKSLSEIGREGINLK